MGHTALETAQRRLVYVSGAPASGKSSLAAPLAAELGYALLAKDKIKEIIHNVLATSPPDPAWSQRLGGTAMELLWALAADAPAVVLEANFRPRSARERAHLSALAARVVEVHCSCPPELALRRYHERSPARHPVHHSPSLPLSAMDEWDRPVGVGNLVTVDTTVPVDIAAVAAAVRARL
jgi:predicted kinase